jgi:eukaryotic-like serine/threonine-protein kinase
MTDAAEDWLGLVGTTLQDKYVVERLVAEGGFSVVYRAQHAVWQQPVAVKVLTALSGQAAADHEKLLAEFFREGALLRELSARTACILQAYDIATYQGPTGETYPYLVLEWLEGKALDEVIELRRNGGAGPWTIDEVVETMEPLARALGVVHRRGVSHRDIKPTNIFFVGYPHDVHVKLLDFGIAKVVNSAAELGAATAKTGGAISSFSPWYGAPEQFSRQYGATGPWTDVFAFALVLVEMLALRDPLLGETIAAVALQSTNREIRPTPRTIGVTVSDAVEAVFQRALAVSPTDRFQTAGDMWMALRAAVSRPVEGSAEMSMLGVPFQGDVGDARLSFLGGPDQRISGAPGSFAAPSTGSGDRLSRPTSRPSLESPEGRRSLATDRTILDPSLALGAVDERGTGAPSSLSSNAAAPPKNRTALVAIAFVSAALLLGGAAFLATRSPGPKVPPLPSATAGALAGTSGSANGQRPPCPPGMVLIPASTFRMGVGEAADGPPHEVTLSAYCLDKTEVTADAYRACQKNGECPPAPRRVDAADIPEGDRDAFSALCTAHLLDQGTHPINCVDHTRAVQYCATQKKRLPTSAEWERAARGPDDRPFPWGNGTPNETRLNACGTECTEWGVSKKVKLTALYNADDGFPATAPVGSFPAGVSAEGAFDLQGNVMEWVADWDGPMSEAPETNPTGPTRGEKRVVRGGVFTTESQAWLRPGFRFALAAESKSHGVGFRCASAPTGPLPEKP